MRRLCQTELTAAVVMAVAPTRASAATPTVGASEYQHQSTRVSGAESSNENHLPRGGLGSYGWAAPYGVGGLDTLNINDDNAGDAGELGSSPHLLSCGRSVLMVGDASSGNAFGGASFAH